MHSITTTPRPFISPALYGSGAGINPSLIRRAGGGTGINPSLTGGGAGVNPSVR
jgi:hypothetical protein